MKKFLIASAIASTLFAPQAFAQAKNFTGLSVGVNANFANSKTDATVTGVGGGNFSASDNAQNASIQAQYGVGLTDKLVLGLGFTYDLGELKGGSIVAGAGTTTLKMKDGYAVYLAPGYAVTANTLAYAKLSYQSAKGVTEGVLPGTSDFSGMGYGLGFRTMLGGQWYLQGEYVQTSYDRKTSGITTFKVDTGVASLGVGYNF